jgi:hypothetical protein
MKQLLRSFADALGASRPVRALVARIVYPTVSRQLLGEIVADQVSPSGVAEAFGWKTHAYLVLETELWPGVNCAAVRLRCDWDTRKRLLDVAQAAIGEIPGDILEFGVAGGESLLMFAEAFPERTVYGFDSFEGLPEAWWTRPKGAFKSTPPLLGRPNVELIEGWFEQTVPRFLDTWPGPAALIHVDCDLYSSTCASLIPVLRRAQPGTVVVFDEYYNYPEFARHEWRAWREAQHRHHIASRCIAYDGRRAAFQILSIDPAGDVVDRVPLAVQPASVP